MSIIDFLAGSVSNKDTTLQPPKVYVLDSYIESVEEGNAYGQRCIKYIHVTPLGRNKYQFNFSDILYINNDSLKKQEDFLRRISYRYDGIILSITKDREILSIHNIADIRFQWEKIKNLLEMDYKGGEVNWFLEQMTEQMNTPENIMKELCLYNWLGLIFKGLSCSDTKCLDGKYRYPVRLLERTIKIEEQYKFVDVENDMQSCTIGHSSKNTKDILVRKYEGLILLKNDCVMCQVAELELEISYNAISKIEKYQLSSNI